MTANSVYCGLIIITLSACSVTPVTRVVPSTSGNSVTPGLLNNKINQTQRRAIMSGEKPDWSDNDPQVILRQKKH